MTTTEIIILTGIISSVVLRILVKQMKAAGRPGSDLASQIPAGMRDLAEKAVCDAQESHNLTLDFSTDSIKHVDTILEDAHQDLQNKRIDQERVGRLALRYGAYVGEVIRRTTGGEWGADQSMLEQGMITVEWEHGSSLPVGWCHKRIENGEEDGLEFKFRVAVLESEKLLQFFESRGITDRSDGQ